MTLTGGRKNLSGEALPTKGEPMTVTALETHTPGCRSPHYGERSLKGLHAVAQVFVRCARRIDSL